MLITYNFLSRVYKQRLDGLDDDGEVEDGGTVFQIINIVLEFLFDVVDGLVGAVMKLSPTGDTGCHQKSRFIIGDLDFQFFDELWAFGSRSDE